MTLKLPSEKTDPVFFLKNTTTKRQPWHIIRYYTLVLKPNPKANQDYMDWFKAKTFCNSAPAYGYRYYLPAEQRVSWGIYQFSETPPEDTSEFCKTCFRSYKIHLEL